MAGRFSHDFSRVRVHTESEAASLAAGQQARAYTVGHHVVFGGSRYAPHSEAGRRLLAHELAHVVQQSAAGMIAVQRQPLGGQVQNPPTASQVTEPRSAVAPADAPAVRQILQFLEQAQTAINNALVAGVVGRRRFTVLNKNVIEVTRRLSRLIDELQAGTLRIRFTTNLPTNTVAQYESLSNTMDLRPFQGIGVRAVAVSMFHEYTHVRQDRAVEARVATTLRPEAQTRGREIAQETEARLQEVYFEELLGAVNLAPPMSPDLGAEIARQVLLTDFEKMQSGTPGERREGAADVDTTISSAYAKQIQENVPGKIYVIEISDANHGLLHADSGTPRDLGAIAATVTTTLALEADLAAKMRAVPRLVTRLLAGPAGGRLAVATFSVVYRGRTITQFGIRP
jgi:hypothetical protein